MDIDRVTWTMNTEPDWPKRRPVSAEHFTNPGTPVLTLTKGGTEVVSICIPWRRLERMDMGRVWEDVTESIVLCYAIATGQTEASRGGKRPHKEPSSR